MKDNKCTTITNAFQNFLDESGGKPSKIWRDRGVDFYNRSMKSWFQNNDTEVHSTYYEKKSVFTERFIRTLKNKTHRYVTSVLKHVYVNKLDDIVN